MYSNLSEYASFYIPKEYYSEKKIDHIFYINLDHRVDRKEKMEEQLKQLDIPYSRFSAIYHSNGAVGCSQSHLEVLKLAKQMNYENVLILEDDFTFLIPILDIKKEFHQLLNHPFSICLISYNLFKSIPTEYPYLQRVLNAQTTSGYIIHQDYYDTLIQCIEPSISLLEQTGLGYLYAIDIVWKSLQKKDIWYCTTTRIGKQAEGFSDIEKKHVDYHV